MAHHSLADFLSRARLRIGNDLDRSEEDVLLHMAEQRPTSRDAGDIAEGRATVGNRLADTVAAIGGSWGFIIGFSAFLACWILLNGRVLPPRDQFDPYPFIFLNLVLSTLAALQAPVIMMSQNRQAAKDRLAATLDYQVNLRTELEILRLHEKIDNALVERLERILAVLATET